MVVVHSTHDKAKKCRGASGICSQSHPLSSRCISLTIPPPTTMSFNVIMNYLEKRYVAVLTPGTAECDLTWKGGCYRCTQLK